MEFEDVFVFLMGEGFAERLDVFKERFDGFLKRQQLVFFGETEFKTRLSGSEFQALVPLCFKGFGGGFSRGGAKPLTFLAPFDEEAAARWPLDALL